MTDSSDTTTLSDDELIDSLINGDQSESVTERSIMNPITGSMVDMDDIDSIIRACEDCKSLMADLKTFDDTVRRRAGEFAKGTSKTRRIQGAELQAKIEMPDETWDQPLLKSLWAEPKYEKFRERYLKLGSVNVAKTEFNKLKGLSSDDETFAVFQSLLLSAEKPATGAPRVTMEK